MNDGTGLVITHCPHGLDLRIHPRCYLCDPIAFEAWGCTCPDYWWGTVPPPCPVHNPPRSFVPTIMTGGTTGNTVRCTCPPNRGDNYVGYCPIHDTQVTYTGGRT